jgi:tRNA A37 threonylcarbamoyladenosine synthetase subunit TsaC/SUA5/YrdC
MKLNSIYSSQKDFYGKANVIIEGAETKLKSYSTIVAVKENNTIKVRGYYSKTTAIHINEFLRQNGASSLSKKEMELEPTINL